MDKGTLSKWEIHRGLFFLSFLSFVAAILLFYLPTYV